jgi:hypothetical protein
VRAASSLPAIWRHRKKRNIGTSVARSRVPTRGASILAKPLVSDALWERIEPLLPPPIPRLDWGASA